MLQDYAKGRARFRSCSRRSDGHTEARLNAGIGAFVSPVISWRNIRGVRAAGAISAPEATIWMALASWPYLLIAAMLGWVVWFVIKF
jgi:hypothetical protein